MVKKHSYDIQLGRLINYAKGLGLEVYFREWKKGDPAAHWTLDGKCIEVFKAKRQSKLSIILSIIHEIGHMVDHIHRKDRQFDEVFDKAITNIDDADEKNSIPSKRDRLIQLKNERAAAKWWDVIYKDCGLTFPFKRLELAREYDLFPYEFYYKKGRWPTIEQYRNKKRELRKKYGYKT